MFMPSSWSLGPQSDHHRNSTDSACRPGDRSTAWSTRRVVSRSMLFLSLKDTKPSSLPAGLTLLGDGVAAGDKQPCLNVRPRKGDSGVSDDDDDEDDGRMSSCLSCSLYVNSRPSWRFRSWKRSFVRLASAARTAFRSPREASRALSRSSPRALSAPIVWMIRLGM